MADLDAGSPEREHALVCCAAMYRVADLFGPTGLFTPDSTSAAAGRPALATAALSTFGLVDLSDNTTE